ncbi:Hypothetical predicted protein [Marmota monax]|uniref:Uncharacterized protein n=1 Tax=Marmota monax TaxID=9995 RepID=A0A5E4C7X2_MARMO|nr:hypothetical protein GHT09_016717 [Marmota monax]VTJ77934.1 Hypothetical predicted protein [Marmota monax]
MSLFARSHQRCAGRGQYAPGPGAHSLRILGVRSTGARDRRSVGNRVCGRFYHPSSGTWGERTSSSPTPPPPPPFRTPRRDAFWSSL